MGVSFCQFMQMPIMDSPYTLREFNFIPEFVAQLCCIRLRISYIVLSVFFSELVDLTGDEDEDDD